MRIEAEKKEWMLGLDYKTEYKRYAGQLARRQKRRGLGAPSISPTIPVHPSSSSASLRLSSQTYIAAIATPGKPVVGAGALGAETAMVFRCCCICACCCTPGVAAAI